MFISRSLEYVCYTDFILYRAAEKYICIVSGAVLGLVPIGDFATAITYYFNKGQQQLNTCSSFALVMGALP